ncbi:N-acetylmuramidase domain-containing protein [Vreelandella neptunia]|uniref:N-acetylmuramidase family protein n=1 Tax=Vreelandella neptunia TaxID=115551 RepID=A0ABZ0YJT6_9GAMM|nr:N-acetylmuramidase family protein [Halomonas neptunia]MDN3562107.1 N-acetylmuramidase family protein [Halomonas neptunia]WQH11809.1 N-acetylmuramidase family protein [Halomonas neptunia]
MLLRQGSIGPSVTALQRELNAVGYDISVDGDFGNETMRAVRSYQRKQGLVTDGIAGPKTRALLHGQQDARLLSQIDLVDAADRLGVELAAVMAVNEVESRGNGFHFGGPRNGMPIILFERHIMRRQLQHHGINPLPYQRAKPDIVNGSPGGYIGGHREHNRRERAGEIHTAASIESSSWGLFQIMGFHWKRLGYESAENYAADMAINEANQLDAFVRFVEKDRGIHAALRRHDWAGFASRYNGPNYAANDYDTKLAAAYRRHSQGMRLAA